MASSELTVYSCHYEHELTARWHIAKDMNCDGEFTITDVGLWAEWAFFLPGDGVLWALMQSQQAAIFFEISPYSYHGWGSGFLSGFIWLITLIVWGVLVDALD